MYVIFFISSLGTILTLVNALTMRVIKPDGTALISDSIAVLVPMRNEESNVDGLVSSVQESSGLSDWNFTVLNDSSSDGTALRLKSHGVSVIEGSDLPEGWLGKNWACHQLASTAQAKYLVFMDADVRIHPAAIAASIEKMNSLGWDFISPYPRQIALSFLERLIQPLLQWSWLSSVPLRLSQQLRINSMTIANGQFFIVKKSAYDAIGGHASIKSEVLDDLRLARGLIAGGFSGGVAEGSSIVECRMYDSPNLLIQGYTKSLWAAFGGIAGTIFTIALLALTQILPIFLGLNGYFIGWSTYFVVAISHGIAAIRTKSAPSNFLLHPLSAFILIVLIFESLRRKLSGSLVWRERKIG